MEIKIENNDLFVKFDGDDHWSNMGSCAGTNLQSTTSYSQDYSSSSYGTGTAMPTEYIKFEPISLREESTVEEVKLKGINIELDAIL